MKDFKKSVLKTVVAVLVLAGVGSYAYFYEFKKGGEEKKKEEEAKRIFSFQKDQVVEMEVTTGGRSALLKKSDGVWKIVKPVAVDADRSAVEGIINAMETFKVERMIEDKPSDLSAYGLDVPRTAVMLKTEDGRMSTLIFGVQNQFDNTWYVMKDGAPKVYQAPSSVRNSIDKDLFALREKRLFFFDKDQDVKKIEVRLPSEVYLLERAVNGDWDLTFGSGQKARMGKADSEEVSRILSSLRSLKASGVVAENPGDLLSLGLGTGAGSIKITKVSGAPEGLMISGKVKPGGRDVVLVKRDGSGTVFETGEKLIKDISKSDFDLMYKKLFSFNRDNVSGIVLASDEGIITLSRESRDGGADVWYISRESGSERKNARSYKVASLLSALEGLKAAGIAGSGARKTGLDKPSGSVTLTDGRGAVVGKVIFGKTEGESIFASSDALVWVALMEKSKVDEIPWSGDDFVDEPTDGK